MATNYYSTATWSNTPGDYHTKISTGLLAMGWTLYDTVGTFSGGGTHHRVYQAPAIANGVTFFIDFFLTGGTFTINACLDWDPVTHTAISEGVGSTVATPGATGYVYCNALGAFWTVTDGTFKPQGFFGQPRCRQVKGKTDGVCLSTASMAASATSVTVNADLTSRLYVGQVVAIQNFKHDSTSANKDHRELVTITSLSAGTLHFTATSLAYDSGAKIGPPDMLYPVSSSGGATFQSFNGSFYSPCTQATGLNQAGTVTSCSITPASAVQGSTGITAGLRAAVTGGLAPEICVGLLQQAEVSDYSSFLPTYGFVFAWFNVSGGVPAALTKYTDGTNVFILVDNATAPGGANPYVLVGPTGDAPNFSTQTRVSVPMVPVSDSIYSNSYSSAPTNALNQGLN